MLNPFDAAGYNQTTMTRLINDVPNMWGRVNELGIFRSVSIPTTSVIVERRLGVLNLLPSVPRGGPATKANRERRDMRAFVVPHIPHDDEVLPSDIQDVRDYGSEDGLMRLGTVIADKTLRMRRKHSLTREYMQLQALKGVLKDGAGFQLYNWFDEFGITKKSIDFNFGDVNSDIGQKCVQISRYLEENLHGETMTGVTALVGPDFMDALTSHPKVQAAYSQFANNGQQLLREDVRRRFPFKGVVFEEYIASFTFADQTTVEKAFTGKTGTAFPTGTNDTFETFNAPAEYLEAVNQPGDEVFAKQVARLDGRAIDLLSESNPLPLVRRPALIVELMSST